MEYAERAEDRTRPLWVSGHRWSRAGEGTGAGRRMRGVQRRRGHEATAARDPPSGSISRPLDADEGSDGPEGLALGPEGQERRQRGPIVVWSQHGR